MNILYPANIKKEHDRYSVQFIDFEDIFTEGENLEHAKAMAGEVLTVMLESKLEHKEDIPFPSKAKGKDIYYIAPEAPIQAAALFVLNKGERSLSDISRAIGTSWAATQRLEDPKHSPTIKTLEKAAAALGKKLVISFE
jgi:antitoxin HicB